MNRAASLAGIILFAVATGTRAQGIGDAASIPQQVGPQASTAGTSAAKLSNPLPDIPTLLRQVEAQQRAEELRQKDYLFHEAIAFDKLDKHSNVKQSESLDTEVFWLNGVRVARVLKKNGRPLDSDEQKKEDDRFNKALDRAKQRRDKAEARGTETDSAGHDEIPFSRIFELGDFSNPRRETINGRDTIVVDYTGNPKARTHSYEEGVFRELAGTVWVDEQDRVIQHLEGHFDHDFKILGGMAASVKKGTWFKASFTKINNDAWLPSGAEADGHASYLVFFSLNGHFKARTSDYRKFKATSTILPHFGKVEVDPAAEPPKVEIPKL